MQNAPDHLHGLRMPEQVMACVKRLTRRAATESVDEHIDELAASFIS